MNQKNIFYLLSLIAIFFIGHYYSQFNIQPVKPEIITINNDDEVKKQKSNILSLQLQLEELNNQLIFSLDELKITSQKLNRSLATNEFIKEYYKNYVPRCHPEFVSEYDLLCALKIAEEYVPTINELKKALSDSEMDIS